jgi:AraC-like DNA-binding protein
MIAWMEERLLEPMTSEDLAVRSGYSPNRFRQKFYNVTGETPSGYLRKRRLTEASKELLAGGRVIDVALRWGYSSQENFTTAFRSFFGVTPKELSKIEGKYRRFIRRMREAFAIMELADLRQPPIATTLMGSIKGVSDYFDLDLDLAMLFGLSGHAFLLNIHDKMCPSGPYVWDGRRFYELLAEQGIRPVGHHTITARSDAAERERLESTLRAHLDAGRLCVLNFLENQLISGYDEQGFLLLQPWGGDAPSEVARITAGTWEECLASEGWAQITVVEKVDGSASVRETASHAIGWGAELFRDGTPWEEPGYRMGKAGYETWLRLVEAGKGSTHGHWWNATVWSECRRFGSEFFTELAEIVAEPQPRELALGLSARFREIGKQLRGASDRELPAAEQRDLIAAALAVEEAAQPELEELATLL